MSTPERVMMIWCPQWAVRSTGRAGDGIPVIVTDKGVVIACSTDAQAAGVDPGLRVREAQRRCPQALLVPDDQQRQARRFDEVLRAIEQVVPGVHPVRPGLAAVRARGARRFYGSEHLAAQELLHTVTDRTGLETRVAVADGLFAAEHVAYATTARSPLAVVRPGESAVFVGTLPVSVLAEAVGSPRMPNLLRRMGIRTLGDLARLRRAQVHARFGADGLRAHRLACGQDAPTLDLQHAPADLRVEITFDEPVARVGLATAQCRPGAARLIRCLHEQSLLCHQLQLIIETEDAEPYRRTWRHPWYFDADDVVDRIGLQLEEAGHTDDPDRLTGAVTRIRLIPQVTSPVTDHPQGLWGDRPDEHVVATLTGLQRTLGRGGVQLSVVTGGRMLDERRARRPFGEAAPTTRQRRLDRPWPGSLPGPAPTTVYHGSEHQVSVLDQQEEPITVSDRGTLRGQPAWLRAADIRPATRRITAWAGPWPVQQRWWQEPQTHRLDRFQVVDECSDAWLLLTENGRWWAEARYE